MVTVGGVDVNEAYREFLRKQEEIYNRSFRNAQITALEPARLVKEGASGYLIVWQYPEEIAEKIAAFGREIARVLPFLPYPAASLHTTISDYQVINGKEVGKADENITRLLTQAVKDVHIKISRPKIIHTGWAFSKDTVIIIGYPDMSFVEASMLILGSALDQKIELRYPWGGHITVGRFVSPVNDPEKLKSLKELFVSAPVGFEEVKPDTIMVGRFIIDSNHLEVEVWRRFRLVK